MRNILLTKDLHELIEFCKTRRMGETIKEKVDDWVAAYAGSNTNLLLHLMEEIEIQVPKIKLEEDFHAEEILSFVEHQNNLENAQLVYLYSYVCFKQELTDMVETNTIGTLEDRQQLGNLEVSEVNPHGIIRRNRTLRCVVKDEDSLRSLHSWMIDNKVIEPIEFDDFYFIFSNQEVSRNYKKIFWILEHKTGQYNYRALLLMLSKLCPEETSPPFHFANIVERFFCKWNGSSFGTSLFRSLNKKNSNDHAATQSKVSEISSKARGLMTYVHQILSQG